MQIGKPNTSMMSALSSVPKVFKALSSQSNSPRKELLISYKQL